MKVGSVVKIEQIEYTLYSFQEPGVSCGFKFMHNRNYRYVEQIKIRRTALRIIEIMLHEYIFIGRNNRLGQ